MRSAPHILPFFGRRLLTAAGAGLNRPFGPRG
jgi:hypothetical protein